MALRAGVEEDIKKKEKAEGRKCVNSGGGGGGGSILVLYSVSGSPIDARRGSGKTGLRAWSGRPRWGITTHSG